VEEVAAAVAVRGARLRELKATKAEKAQVDSEVATLLALKARFQEITGEPFPSTAASVIKKQKDKQSAPTPSRELASARKQNPSDFRDVRRLKGDALLAPCAGTSMAAAAHAANQEPVVTPAHQNPPEAHPFGTPAATPAPTACCACRCGSVCKKVALVWFRLDFRLHDNPALIEAIKQGYFVVPVFIWGGPAEEGEWGHHGATEVWMQESLRRLGADLRSRGSRLILREATDAAGTLGQLRQLVAETGASAVFFNRRYEPAVQQADHAISTKLQLAGVQVSTFNALLLYEPDQVRFDGGKWHGHFATLMPFYKACQALGKPRRPMPAPLASGSRAAGGSGCTFPMVPTAGCEEDFWPASCSFEELSLAHMPVCPKTGRVIDWGKKIRGSFEIGEQAAVKRMELYVQTGLKHYEQKRNRADIDGVVSKLSPHLHFGELSVRAMFWAVEDAKAGGLPREKAKTFERRLIWRDLAYFQLHVFKRMTDEPIRAHYADHAWRDDPNGALLAAWQQGKTGYPMVDAGMRELWHTGWMHQNVRMITASFLTEYMGMNWVDGERWYADTLVDADAAINAMMWQNAGRSGIDQWNFLMSPENGSQDPTGDYVRKWIPELAALPAGVIHRPWTASKAALQDAGVALGRNYPARIITDLPKAREWTAEAMLAMRRRNLEFNDGGGYDVVSLPDGSSTRVFTKQEYRLDGRGQRLNPSAAANKGGGGGAGKHAFGQKKGAAAGGRGGGGKGRGRGAGAAKSMSMGQSVMEQYMLSAGA
jgi:deoxyribodipyrimidine photolyase